MKRLWKTTKETLKEAFKNAFFSDPFHIVGKDVDNLMRRATFSLKAKRIPTTYKLQTKEIIHDDRFLFGLSSSDRKQVEKQYLLEMKQPQACIEEYPLIADKNNQYIFKILLLENRKIVCGSASYFINSDKETLAMLNPADIVKISLAYYKERFGESSPNALIGKTSTNIHYLK